MGSSSINQFKRCVAGLLTLVSSTLFCAEASLNQEGHWLFSGMVSNEKGEQYAYFFEMKHEGALLKNAVALFDMQSHQAVFEEQSSGVYQSSMPDHWEVGHAFLHFNAITGSWVFGVKTKDKQGFNFKMDMMNAGSTPIFEERLRPGLKVSLIEVKALNGHLYQSKHQDEFVTATHAWLRQETATAEVFDEAPHLVSGLLCHFEDESGFYALKLPERDAIRGAIAGRFDAEGQIYKMSQFVDIQKNKQGTWDIHSILPEYHLTLSHVLEQDSLTMGFITHDDQNGFCLLSRDLFQTHTL